MENNYLEAIRIARDFAKANGIPISLGDRMLINNKYILIEVKKYEADDSAGNYGTHAGIFALREWCKDFCLEYYVELCDPATPWF